ncbi:hypothetical protein EDM80_14640 [bacterium]|nr:MAG: hypothetical protein EDM80_14640 [bacterium]
MRKDAITIEESRVADEQASLAFPPFKERHRVFPAIFENRNHKKILDLAAGVGYVTQRVLEQYPAKIISHDLSVVKFISDEVAVMCPGPTLKELWEEGKQDGINVSDFDRGGHIVEYASSDEIYANPRHAYTKRLTEAIPSSDLEEIKRRVAARVQ